MGGQSERSMCALDGTRLEVHAQIPDPHDATILSARAHAPHNRPYARHDFTWTEGFNYIVVRSQLEADDSIAFSLFGSEHDDGDVRLSAHLSEYLIAVYQRKHVSIDLTRLVPVPHRRRSELVSSSGGSIENGSVAT